MRRVKGKGFATFGQELYFEESIRAIEEFGGLAGSDELREKIAGLLLHDSPSTRLRVASKIIQRFFRGPDRKSPAWPFLKLVAGIKSESARRDLLYWRTARTDRVVAAIAGEIFYPFFVLDNLPAGYDEPLFRLDNTASLFSMDSVISRDLVVKYTRRMWKFDSPRSVTLALRIMKQAEILDAISVVIGRRHMLGYYPRPHSPAVETFVYCTYEEFPDDGGQAILSLDRVQNGEFARTFLLSRLQMDSLLRSAEKKGYVQSVSLPGGRHVQLAIRSLDGLVDGILGR